MSEFSPEDFNRVYESPEEEQYPIKHLNSWEEAFYKLIHKPVAIFCLFSLILVILGALIIPFLSPFDYAGQNVAFSNKPFFSVDPVNGAMHWFGTDKLGRDIFVRLWFSVRISLLVAVAVTLIDCFVGVVYGSISGYLGGTTDLILMRIVDVVNGIPYLLVVLLLMTVLPRGLGTLIIAYSITGWTGMARLVRGQVLNLREQEFFLASQTLGAGLPHILKWHILPNIITLIIVNITLDIPNVIFTEAFLSLLGLGIDPPMPSLGIMANDGISMFQMYPSQLVVPAFFICLLMLCFNLLGDCLQDALEPGIKRGNFFEKTSLNKKSSSKLS